MIKKSNLLLMRTLCSALDIPELTGSERTDFAWLVPMKRVKSLWLAHSAHSPPTLSGMCTLVVRLHKPQKCVSAQFDLQHASLSRLSIAEPSRNSEMRKIPNLAY